MWVKVCKKYFFEWMSSFFLDIQTLRTFWEWRLNELRDPAPFSFLCRGIRAYSSSRRRLVTLCCWHTPAGAQTIVSDQEREGRQIKTLSIVASQEFISRIVVRAPPMWAAVSRGISQGKTLLFSLWGRPGPFIFSEAQIYLSTERRQQRWCAFTF